MPPREFQVELGSNPVKSTLNRPHFACKTALTSQQTSKIYWTVGSAGTTFIRTGLPKPYCLAAFS